MYTGQRCICRAPEMNVCEVSAGKQRYSPRTLAMCTHRGKQTQREQREAPWFPLQLSSTARWMLLRYLSAFKCDAFRVDRWYPHWYRNIAPGKGQVGMRNILQLKVNKEWNMWSEKEHLKCAFSVIETYLKCHFIWCCWSNWIDSSYSSVNVLLLFALLFINTDFPACLFSSSRMKQLSDDSDI